MAMKAAFMKVHFRGRHNMREETATEDVMSSRRTSRSRPQSAHVSRGSTVGVSNIDMPYGQPFPNFRTPYYPVGESTDEQILRRPQSAKVSTRPQSAKASARSAPNMPRRPQSAHPLTRSTTATARPETSRLTVENVKKRPQSAQPRLTRDKTTTSAAEQKMSRCKTTPDPKRRPSTASAASSVQIFLKGSE